MGQILIKTRKSITHYLPLPLSTRSFSNRAMVRTGGSRNLFDDTSSNSSSINNGKGDTYDSRKMPWRSFSSQAGGKRDNVSSSYINKIYRDDITQTLFGINATTISTKY